MESNIENFNKATLFILSHLYDSFPKKIEIDTFNLTARKFVAETGSHLLSERQEDPTKEGGDLDFLNYVTDTMIWLGEEGYLRKGEFTPPHKFSGVILTNKGLSLLQKPSSLDQSKRWIDMCKEEFKKGTAKGIYKVGQELMYSGISKLLASEE